MVSQDARLANEILTWLGDAGYHATLVTTFSAAKVHLETRPDVMISDVKLGEYNGLHLALKARTLGVLAIVTGPPDTVLEKDAKALNAIYLRAPLDQSALAAAVCRSIVPRMEGRSPKRVNRGLPVTTDAAEADLLWRAFAESSAPLARGVRPN